MSYDPEEAWMDAAREEYEAEVGARYLREFGYELYPDHYEEAIEEFTAERLQSYYVAHPNLAEPALDALLYAQSLLLSHARAALVFAATAMELAIKLVLLKPIVFGLVHMEGLASFITELTTQHTGMDRFQTLLTVILAQFGGVDLKTFTRSGSAKTLWQEIEEVQRARNAVVHRGERADDASAALAVSVASTLLNSIFPQVLAKLNLHLHDPGVVCGKTHGVTVSVHFPIPGHVPSISGQVILKLESLDLDKPPETISGKLDTKFPTEGALSLRSAEPGIPMWITSTKVHYEIRFLDTSNEFIGKRAASSPSGGGD